MIEKQKFTLAANSTASVKPSEILTPQELAARLKVPLSWIYRHAATLGAYKLGKYLRFNESIVLARIASASDGWAAGSSTQRLVPSETKPKA